MERKSSTEVAETTKPMTELEQMQARLTSVENQLTIVEGVLANAAGMAKGAQRFGTTHTAKKVLDTVTGITYDSLSKCGAVVAPSLEIPVTNTCWYAVRAKCPDRFQILG